MPIHGDGRSRVPVRLNRISTATHSLGSTGSSSSKGHIGEIPPGIPRMFIIVIESFV